MATCRFIPARDWAGTGIPIDPFYLTWKAREYGISTRFIELAGEVNTFMPEYVVTKTILALNSVGKAVKGSHILILGVAYKKNVDDMRESPALELMERLVNLGAVVSYSDPHVPALPKLRKYGFDMESIPLTPSGLSESDLVLLATDHDRFDWKMVKEYAKLVVDTRGVYEPDGKKFFRA